MDSQIYLKNVVSLTYNPLKCTGCGMCIIVCPHRVFQLKDKKALIVNKDHCMECGACAINCEEEAITVNKGVGCASAVLSSQIKKTEPACGCSNAKCN